MIASRTWPVLQGATSRAPGAMAVATGFSDEASQRGGAEGQEEKRMRGSVGQWICLGMHREAPR